MMEKSNSRPWKSYASNGPPWMARADVNSVPRGNSIGGRRVASGTELPAMNGIFIETAVSYISFAQSQR